MVGVSCLEEGEEEQRSIVDVVQSILFTRDCSHVEIITNGLLQFVIDGVFLKTFMKKLSKVFGQTWKEERTAARYRLA